MNDSCVYRSKKNVHKIKAAVTIEGVKEFGNYVVNLLRPKTIFSFFLPFYPFLFGYFPFFRYLFSSFLFFLFLSFSYLLNFSLLFKIHSLNMQKRVL